MGAKANFGVEMARILPVIMREVGRRHDTIFTKGGMELSHIIVLDALREKNVLTMGELAGILHMSMGAVTGIVDKMVEKGLVRRERSSEDRRVVQVDLRKKGRDAAEMVNKARIDLTNELYSVLTDKERDEYLALIKKVYKGVIGRQ